MSAARESLSKEELLTLTNYLTHKSYEQGLADGKSATNLEGPDPGPMPMRPPLKQQFDELEAAYFSLLEEHDALRSQVQDQDARMEFLRREIGSLVNDRDALRDVLAEIAYEYKNSYDADCEPGGSWKAAASLPVDLMELAAALVGAK